MLIVEITTTVLVGQLTEAIEPKCAISLLCAVSKILQDAFNLVMEFLVD
jgi:hypothetical protein